MCFLTFIIFRFFSHEDFLIILHVLGGAHRRIPSSLSNTRRRKSMLCDAMSKPNTKEQRVF